MNVTEIFKVSNKKTVGFTRALLGKGTLRISHGGNMGNSIEHSVNPNLSLMGLPSVDELKKEFTVLEESGSPDYMWYIILKI